MSNRSEQLHWHILLQHKFYLDVQIVLSPQITGAGIEALAGLSSLQACCFESSQASPQALHAVSSLRGLTSAEVSPSLVGDIFLSQ